MDEKCRCSRFRFRLRTLLIGVTLAGMLFAYSAPIIRKWQQDAAYNASTSERIATALGRLNGRGLRGHSLHQQIAPLQRQTQK